MGIKFKNQNKIWSKEDIEKCLDMTKTAKELSVELGRSVASIYNCRTCYEGVDLDDYFTNRASLYGRKQGNYLYRLWTRVRYKCRDKQANPIKPKDRFFTWYEPWDDFETFKSWCYANGYKDNKFLYFLRKDTLKGYSPENCYFSEFIDNDRNSLNHLWEYNGEVKLLKNWAPILGVSLDYLKMKLSTYNHNVSTPFHNFKLETILKHGGENSTMEKASACDHNIQKDILRDNIDAIESQVMLAYQKGFDAGQKFVEQDITDDYKKGMLSAYHLIDGLIHMSKEKRKSLFKYGDIRDILAKNSIFDIESICLGGNKKEIVSYDVGDEIIVNIDGKEETMLICKKEGDKKDPVYHAFNSYQYWTGTASMIQSKTGRNTLKKG